MARKKHKEKPIISIIITIGAIIVALFLGQMTTFLSLENDLLDYRFKIRGSLNISESPIVILAIDDQSDESTPHRWPWPRAYFAHVIENLNEAGVKAIGIDIIFDQPDINGPESDSLFADALSRYENVVISGKIEAPRGRTDLVTLVDPYDEFVDTGVSWGLVSFDLDPDGFYRRYLVGQTFNDSVYSSFATEVIKKYLKEDPQTRVNSLPDKFIFGSYVIPKYNSYSSLINYAGPAKTFPHYSFDSVLDDVDFDLREEFDLDVFDDPGDPDLGLPPGLLYSGQLKDKIVLIGYTMQELHDEFPTPFLEARDSEGRLIQVLTNGVEIHANALNMILTENYLKKLGFGFQLGLVLIFIIIVYLFTRYLPTLLGTVLTTFLIVGYFVFAFWIFSNGNWIFEISTPLLAIVLDFWWLQSVSVYIIAT